MNHRIFREYDIRGVAARDLPDAVVERLGRALAAFFLENDVTEVALGRDCRLSSPRLHAIVKRTFAEAGVSLRDVGVVHSPGLYFAVAHHGLDGGVMITASHNAGEDNGFKIVHRGSTIFGAEIQRLRSLCEEGAHRVGEVRGRYAEASIWEAYVDALVAQSRLGARRFPLVVDAGNGTGGLAAIPALQRLGFEVDALHCEPDGRFPHHHPDPTVASNLSELRDRVLGRGAEVGLAFDGDADRLGVVDGRGRILWGDQLLLLFSRAILAQQPGATIVGDVKCSQILFEDIKARGGRAVMGPAGHSVVKSTMRTENAVLGGEMSGHLFFADRWYGFDDAVYAAVRLVELLSREPRVLATLVDELPVCYNTPEIRLACPDEVKEELVHAMRSWLRERPEVLAVSELDGARVALDGGWALIRASHTGPVLVLRFEAQSHERLAEIRDLIETRVRTLFAERGLSLTPSAH